MDSSQNTKRSRPIPPPLDLRGESSSNSNAITLKEFATLATGPRSPLMQKSLPFRKRAHSVPDELNDGHVSPPLDLSVLSSSRANPVRTPNPSLMRLPPQPWSPAILLSPPLFCNTSELLSPAPSSVGSSQEDLRAATSSTASRPSPTVRRPEIESAWRLPWPQPVWGCFQLGTLIRVVFGGRELVSLSEDVLNNPDWRALYPERIGPLVVQRTEIIANSSNCVITFTSSGQPNLPNELVFSASCVPYHTFFVAEKGWCAVSSEAAKQRYGMSFQILECGDIICQMPIRFDPVSSPDICDRFKRFSFPPEEKSPNMAPLMSPLCPFILSPPSTPTQTQQVQATQASPQHHPTPTQSPSQAALQPTQPQLQPQPLPLTQSQFVLQSLPKDSKQPRAQTSVDADRPKRPMNAFMLFAKQHRLKLIQMHPGKDNRFVSVILGEAWRQLPAEKKEVFIAEARALSHERKRLYPECWKRKRTHSAS